MVSTLYLIRHGETEGGDVKRYKGSIDVPLSARGVGQMEVTARFVSEHLKTAEPAKYLSYLKDIHGGSADRQQAEEPKLQAVYCSDLSRAVRSAGIVASPHGLSPVVVPALRERNFGIWEGMSFIEIREQYPDEFASWAGNPLRFSPIRGESTLEVKDRVIPALEEIMARHAGECVAIAAHGGVNRIILCHILGMPLENIFRIEQDHGAVNIIEFWDKYPVVKAMNFTMNRESTDG